MLVELVGEWTTCDSGSERRGRRRRSRRNGDWVIQSVAEPSEYPGRECECDQQKHLEFQVASVASLEHE